MKISVILFFILLSTSIARAQTVTNHIVEPKGAYKEIDTKNDQRIMTLLLDSGNSTRQNLVDSIVQYTNSYTPPVLYVLSHVFFASGKYNEAIFWFYLAQLRARYDVNRCFDKTASAAEYNQTFGPNINKYSVAHLDDLEKIIPRVVEFERLNEEKYDQRWINLTGMDAMTTALADKADQTPLSKDKVNGRQ
jgi:hypothetical protein